MIILYVMWKHDYTVCNVYNHDYTVCNVNNHDYTVCNVNYPKPYRANDKITKFSED